MQAGRSAQRVRGRPTKVSTSCKIQLFAGSAEDGGAGGLATALTPAPDRYVVRLSHFKGDQATAGEHACCCQSLGLRRWSGNCTVDPSLPAAAGLDAGHLEHGRAGGRATAFTPGPEWIRLCDLRTSRTARPPLKSAQVSVFAVPDRSLSRGIRFRAGRLTLAGCPDEADTARAEHREVAGILRH